MADNFSNIEDLIIKYLQKEQTEAEQTELEKWIAASDKNKALFEQLSDQKTLETKLQAYHKFEAGKEEARQKLVTTKIREISPSIQIRKRLWPRIAAAASILLILSTGAYFLFFNKTRTTETATIQPGKDVEAPKSTKAMITLANGQTVALDSVTSGTLAMQGDVSVIKNADGEIVYSGPSTSSGSNEIAYNTLFNPRGSKVVNLTLHDGTKVWLNAESSIKFPTAFIGAERKVEITGEAYFEVAHNKVMPFIVQKNPASSAGRDVSVKVLGTHFNVNSYDDEAELKITLLEGSVSVAKGQSSMLIKPGQQARIVNNLPNGDAQAIKISKVDTEEVMAWKNGRFHFSNTDVKEIMQQISRWYDVDVTFEPGIKNREFTGKISREVNVSKVLEMLEYAGLEFKIEGKKITVIK